MGIISGYPVGAKIAADFRKNNVCSKEECERLLSFTNNSGPLFIIGSIGITMFNNTMIGILLFITHLLSSITVGIIFRFWKCNKSQNFETIKSQNVFLQKDVNLSNLGQIISESISSSISTILIIGGFIITFSSIISIFNASGLIKFVVSIFSPITNVLNIDSTFIQGIFTGLLEITNGINTIANIPIKHLSYNIIITAFLLGFGGISVLLQVVSIISKTDLSCKPYVIGKILQGVLAVFYTSIFINIIPMFNFDLH